MKHETRLFGAVMCLRLLSVFDGSVCSSPSKVTATTLVGPPSSPTASCPLPPRSDNAARQRNSGKMTGDLSPVYPMASGDPEDASDGRSSTTDLCWPHQDSYSETSSISEANSTDETSSTMHSDKPLSKRALRLQQRNARREAAMAAERAITDLSAAFESLGHDAPADMTFEQASGERALLRAATVLTAQPSTSTQTRRTHLCRLARRRSPSKP